MPSPGGTPLVLAAFDKFRGTATAREACDAAAAAAEAAGLAALSCPLADGGEGTLDAVGGEIMRATVAGPTGTPVDAEWRLLDTGDGPVTGVIEMARASGMALVGTAAENDPMAATTRGVGELIVAALEAGCRRIVVGCGGSATTDGGAGALEVLSPDQLRGVELLAACDVETLFGDAARVFGPQKGADPDQVVALSGRLAKLATEYLARYGVDVRSIPRSGAAGGLGGGLAAVGGHLVSGFELFARIVGFPAALEHADLVVTGEGRLDSTSLEGKVVGGVVAMASGRAPVLVIAGDAGPGILEGVDQCTVVSLTQRFGESDARTRTTELIARVVRANLRTLGC